MRRCRSAARAVCCARAAASSCRFRARFEPGFCRVQTPPEFARLVGQPGGFRRRLRQLRGRAACLLVGFRGGLFGRLQGGPCPFHRRRRGRHPCRPDGPEPGLFRCRFSAGSFRRVCGPVRRFRPAGGGRWCCRRTLAVPGAAPVPGTDAAWLPGTATAPARSTTSTPSAESVRSRQPLCTAAAAPGSAVAARRVCSTSVATAALIARPCWAARACAVFTAPASSWRRSWARRRRSAASRAILRGLHRRSQRGELPQDFGAVRRQHVHRPRRHRRLGQGADFGRQGALLGGGDTRGTDVFGRGRSCSHELAVRQGIERPGNAREFPRSHARIIGVRPRREFAAPS